MTGCSPECDARSPPHDPALEAGVAGRADIDEGDGRVVEQRLLPVPDRLSPPRARCRSGCGGRRYIPSADNRRLLSAPAGCHRPPIPGNRRNTGRSAPFRHRVATPGRADGQESASPPPLAHRADNDGRDCLRRPRHGVRPAGHEHRGRRHAGRRRSQRESAGSGGSWAVSCDGSAQELGPRPVGRDPEVAQWRGPTGPEDP